MKNRFLAFVMLVAVVGLAGCASHDSSVGRFKVGKPYNVGGKTYYPEENYTQEETGIASWYGPGFHGRKTANGEEYDQDGLTAAHPTLQLPSLVRVTNLDNGRSVVVRVTDRGPFHSNRVIDVSKRAADLLDFRRAGTAKVKLQVLGPESRALAAAAKRGVSTREAEIAVNNTGRLDERFAAFYPSDVQMPQPMPTADNVMVADAGGMTGSVVDQIPQTYTTYQPQSPVEQAVAYNADSIAPASGDTNASVPYPPNLPPQRSPQPERQLAAGMEPAITRTRAGGARHPGIPVAMLEPGDLAPAPYKGEPVHVETVPVRPTQIYVQAGSFMSQGNARKVQEQLGAVGPTRIVTASVGGQSYYRVRIGPVESVDKADAVVNTLRQQGREATIIVSEN